MISPFFRCSIPGAGTTEVTTLTGYIAALADTHCVRARTILGALDSAGSLGLEGSIRWILQQGRTINAYGSLQRRVLAALILQTSQPELELSCLGRLAPAFAANGVGAIKRHRHWCPLCFQRARKADEPAADLLAWQVCDVALCIRDLAPLEWRCPKCGAPQDFIPANGALDTCGHCGCPLTDQTESQTHRYDALGAAYQLWLCRVVPELLLDLAAFRSLKGNECSAFLRALTGARRGTLESLAQHVGVPLDTLLQWSRQRSKPTLLSWLRFCASLGVTPARTLADPIQAALQLPLPVPGVRLYCATRTAPTPRHSGTAIRAAIVEQLNCERPTVTSVAQLARIIHVPIGTVYFHARMEARALAAKLLELDRRKRTSRERNLRRRAGRAVARLRKRGEPVTRRAVVRILALHGSDAARRGKLAASEAIAVLRAGVIAAGAVPGAACPIKT